MWDKIKVGIYIAIPIILYFLAALVRSRLQKERILDLARSYVKKETKIKQEKIKKLEKEYNQNEKEILNLKDGIAQRKFELAKKYRKEGLRDKDILDLFGD